MKENLSFSGSDAVAMINIPKFDSNEYRTYTLGSLQTMSYSVHTDKHPVRSLGNINPKAYVMGSRTIAGSLVFAVFNKHFAKDIIEMIKEEQGSSYDMLADEMPYFDMTVVYANEYGNIARLALYGVSLMNEGKVISVNDVFTENTFQFVALNLEYLDDPSARSNQGISQESPENMDELEQTERFLNPETGRAR